MPTLLAVSGAKPVKNLPGRSLLPLMRGENPKWRDHLFTEFHLHSAHNFYPQRTIRNARFKLIQNLMPGEMNPGYDFTLKRFFADLPAKIDSAPDHIRAAYHRMKKPPAFELYDLQNDPYEFHNLADDPKHATVLNDLKARLKAWRVQTADPLLDANNLARLKAEVDACFVKGSANKAKLKLTYPDYFFATTAQRKKGKP
jgi:N-sulfoglucosamine sulfohydrolase